MHLTLLILARLHKSMLKKCLYYSFCQITLEKISEKLHRLKGCQVPSLTVKIIKNKASAELM